MRIQMDEFSMIYEEWTSCKTVKPEKDFTAKELILLAEMKYPCLLYTSPSPRDSTSSRMPSSA